MLETILQQRYYITAVLLFSIGFVTLHVGLGTFRPVDVYKRQPLP